MRNEKLNFKSIRKKEEKKKKIDYTEL